LGNNSSCANNVDTMSKRLRDKGDGWKDVVGNPDEWDRNNLKILIDKFMKAKFRECDIYDMDCDDNTCKHPRNISGAEWSRLAIQASRRDLQLEEDSITTNPYGLKNKESDSRVVTSMPELLHHLVAETMPTVFTEKEHLEWFIKYFKGFLVPSKY